MVRRPQAAAIALLLLFPWEGLKIYGERAEHPGKRLNRSVQLILRWTSSEINDLVRNRQVEAALLSGYGTQGRKDLGAEKGASGRLLHHPSG